MLSLISVLLFNGSSCIELFFSLRFDRRDGPENVVVIYRNYYIWVRSVITYIKIFYIYLLRIFSVLVYKSIIICSLLRLNRVTLIHGYVYSLIAVCSSLWKNWADFFISLYNLLVSLNLFLSFCFVLFYFIYFRHTHYCVYC